MHSLSYANLQDYQQDLAWISSNELVCFMLPWLLTAVQLNEWKQKCTKCQHGCKNECAASSKVWKDARLVATWLWQDSACTPVSRKVSRSVLISCVLFKWSLSPRRWVFLDNACVKYTESWDPRVPIYIYIYIYMYAYIYIYKESKRRGDNLLFSTEGKTERDQQGIYNSPCNSPHRTSTRTTGIREGLWRGSTNTRIPYVSLHVQHNCCDFTPSSVMQPWKWPSGELGQLILAQKHELLDLEGTCGGAYLQIRSIMTRNWIRQKHKKK